MNSNTLAVTKIVLVSLSQGERGNEGKKKIYQIIWSGNKVVLSWGKAEEERRQTSTKFFGSAYAAQNFVMEKKWEKLDKGYTIAYTA